MKENKAQQEQKFTGMAIGLPVSPATHATAAPASYFIHLVFLRVIQQSPLHKLHWILPADGYI